MGHLFKVQGGLRFVGQARAAVWCLAWALLAAGPALGGEIHSWTDADGVRRFSDQPPPDVDPATVRRIPAVTADGQVRNVDRKPAPYAARRSAADEAAAEAERLRREQEEARRREMAAQAEAERLAAEKKRSPRQRKSAAKKARIRAAKP